MDLPKLDIKLDIKADLTIPLSEVARWPSKAAGKIWDLLFGKKELLAEYQKKCLHAQAEHDSLLIVQGDLLCDPLTGAITQYTKPQPQAYDIITIIERQQEQKNLADNLRIALGKIQEFQDDQVSDDQVSPDWFARWRREAKVIGNPGLQMLWGRVLAEEVINPQSISFRTLDILKNITPMEAEIFQAVAKFRLSSVLVSNIDTILSGGKQGDINHDTAMILTEAGLVVDTQVVSIDSNKQHQTTHYYSRNDAWVSIELNREGIPYPLSGYQLTKAGCEIARIADKESLDGSVLQYFAMSIVQSYPATVKRICAHPLKDGEPDFNNLICEYIQSE